MVFGKQIGLAWSLISTALTLITLKFTNLLVLNGWEEWLVAFAIVWFFFMLGAMNLLNEQGENRK